jgi:hypothetical protein
MIVGTIIILAYFGMLSAEYRYSRAVILFSGVLGAVGLVGLREVLHWLGIARFVRYNQVPKRAIIAGDVMHYSSTAEILEQVHYAPDIIGRVGVSSSDTQALAPVTEMKPLLQAMNINEVVFCINGLAYETVLQQMQHCGSAFDYKIHLPGSRSFVGSNSSHSSGDLYTADKRYNIGTFTSLRNKRVFDICAALLLLGLSPLLLFRVKSPAGLYAAVFAVLSGRRTWIGYSRPEPSLPPIRAGILPPYTLQEHYTPDIAVQSLADQEYAEKYVPGIDFSLLLKNLSFIGKK